MRTPRVAVVDEEEVFASLMEALPEDEGDALVRPGIGASDPAGSARACRPRAAVASCRRPPYR